MNDLLEHDLRETYAERDASYDPAPAAERLRARSYRPRAVRRRGRFWAAAGAFGTALTGGAIAAVLLLSSGASVAYAGWTPVPTIATAAAVATATAACNNGPGSPPVLTGQPVLTDARGIYTAAVYVVGQSTWICISDGRPAAPSMNTVTLGLYAAPGPDQLGLPAGGGGSAQGFGQPSAAQSDATPQNFPGSAAQFRALLRRGIENHLVGLAGKDVSAVSFVFGDGSTVDATVENGWYFAWWPGLDDPTSVQVTTDSGTVTSPMPSAQLCPTATASCGVFAGLSGR